MPSPEARAVRILSDLGRRLSEAATPETLVSHASGALHDLLSPDHLLFVLVESDGRTRSVAYAHNYLTPRADDPLVGVTLEHGPMVIPRDVGPRLQELGVTPMAIPGSWIGVPINAAGCPIGSISLSSDTPNRYDDTDLLLLQAVAAQCAVALANARLLNLLESSKREWEVTADALQLPFCVVDGKGMIRRANRAFGELLNTPAAALSGHPWLDIVPKAWTEPMARALAKPGGEAELVMPHQVFKVVTSPISTTDGNDSSVVVLDDRTETRRLRDQLVHSEKLSAIGQLIAGVAHDLNNPLASVVGFAEYLVEGGTEDIPARLVDPLTTIHQQATRAANIARNVLVFSRKQDVQRRTAQIGPILRSTLALLNNQLIADGVEVTLEVPEDTPPVVADTNRLQQVFVNLVINAAQAIRISGVGGGIVVTAVADGDRVVVTVEDDGPGISDAVADRIFEPFFSTRADGEGTGLGLAICREIVEEHSGRISFVQRPGGGALFQVELPVGTASVGRREEEASETGALHILVIDDEEPFRRFLRAVLETWGHTVALAADSQEGLALVPGQRFDMILCDLRMPRMSGRHFLDVLRQEHPAAAERLVFCTGDAVDAESLSFLESVGRPYLEKPFTLRELRAMLTKAVGGTGSA